MKTLLHKAGERGQAEYGWLTTRYSFSFAGWYEPSRMGFGKLRVLNDDIIAPANGFAPHAHRDMEIVTLVTEGAVTHEDSMGNKKRVAAGEVQVMSAGTGVVHAERNESPHETLKLFQIWIEPRAPGGCARYAQNTFDLTRPGETLLVAPDAQLSLGQDAWLSLVNLKKGEEWTYQIKKVGNGVYFFIIEGSVSIATHELDARDALGVWEAGEVSVLSKGDGAQLIAIEVPR
jgi:redox-sensitive bicupin YhaK (pirin superfamily)